MTSENKISSPENNWANSLAAFLNHEAEIEAVRLDPVHGRLGIATFGKEVDLEPLGEKLSAVIELHQLEVPKGEKKVASLMGELPEGFSIIREKEGFVFRRGTCETAPILWRWREFGWPEGDDLAEDSEREWKILALSAGVCGAALISAFSLGRLLELSGWIPFFLYMVAMMAGGWDAAVDSIKKLRVGVIDIHFLMLAVAIGASLVGAYGEGALLLFLFSTSSALEAFALHRTHREITGLLKTAPKHATRIQSDGTHEQIAIEMVSPGERLLVRPGEMFPVDGVVLKGRSAADESNLSGESTPVEKDVGEEVSSGTINLWGAVELKVLRHASQSTLQKIILLIRNAQKLKAPSQRFTDKFGVGYTYFVLGLCFSMFFVWWLWLDIAPFTVDGEGYSAFYRTMTLLVVMSPCALVLSIPSAILAAIAWGARNGILFRGGAAIEKLAEVSVVALDKTGTLTTGQLVVADVESFPAGKEQEVLEIACALEKHSQHPIAGAITQYGRKKGIQTAEVEDFQSLTGKGLRGRYRDASTLLGRRELMEEGPLKDWIKTVPQTGAEMSEVWVLYDDLIGRILLRDEVRQESKGVLVRLKEMGIRVVMLTGDRSHTAEAVGRELGLDEVRAGLSPEQKVEAIRELGQNETKVAMVGDGVNDAPSLAAAYVSVAMGARGSDAALEQSEIVLVNDKIDNFLKAFSLSQRSRRIIKQNLFISLGTVVFMALAAAFVQVPLSLGVFAHEGSTVVVCLNSLRLLLKRS
jgi:Cd2+/Zn2+-exporting ATPase